MAWQSFLAAVKADQGIAASSAANTCRRIRRWRANLPYRNLVKADRRRWQNDGRHDRCRASAESHGNRDGGASTQSATTLDALQ